MPISLLIVESCEIVRIGLRVWLKNNKEITLAGEAASVGEACELLLPWGRPDVMLVDCTASENSILSELGGVLRQKPQFKVLLWGPGKDNQRFIRAALRAGVRGYCLKSTSSEALCDAVRTVFEGKVWVHRALARPLQSSPPADNSALDRPRVLSTRETQIIHLVAEGFSNAQISAHLGISVDTVKTHIRKILEKLDAHDRTQAAIKAMRFGLLVEGGGLVVPTRSELVLH